MNLFSNLSRLQIGIFAVIVCAIGVLGYLFYDTHRTNIQDRELIKQTNAENLDLTQDLQIMKEKFEYLKKDVDALKTKVAKVTYKKKNYRSKRLQAAGKSSKYKKHYKKSRVSYKKLYFQLKNQCEKVSKKKTRNYSRKYYR